MAGCLLTTLANAEAWIGNLSPGANTATDALITRLIAAASQQILGFLSRSVILPTRVSETRDGTGGPRLMLRQWPLIAVSSLSIDGQAILPGSYSGTPGASGDCGYFAESWDGVPPGRAVALELNGYRFCRGKQNVAVSYTAGYEVSAEPQTVAGAGGPPVYSVTATQPYGNWASDQGVTYATGAALTKVAGPPGGAGEYELGAAPGQYLFNSADNGASVLISYGFVPSVLEQACIELVTVAYRRATMFEGLGGITEIKAGDSLMRFAPVSAALLATPEISVPLQPYRKVAPF